MKDIKEIRNKINLVDKQMAELFQQRMQLCHDVADYKKEHALPIEDLKRENEIIHNNSQMIEDLTLRPYYIDYLHALMNISKHYQCYLNEGMKIAYCGVEGAFAFIAAKKVFDCQQLIAFENFSKAYEAVENGQCDACVLPLENSYAGEVGEVMDLMFSGSLYLNNIISLNITHNLLAKKETNISQIKNVISHPQALAQCKPFLNDYHFNTIAHSNTAIAAKELALSNDLTTAVIASEDVASIYNLKILKGNINENKNNTTRFGVFTKILQPQQKLKTGNHFILLFTVLNEAGALAKALNIIGAHNFNMRTLKSRPLKQLIWNYYFFVEIDGTIDSIDGQDMLIELKSVCYQVKVVGTYYSHIEK